MTKEVVIPNVSLASHHSAHDIIDALKDLSKVIKISLTDNPDEVKFLQGEVQNIVNQITANWQFQNRLVDNDWFVVIERATGKTYITKQPELIDGENYLVVSRCSPIYYDHFNLPLKREYLNLPELVFYRYSQQEKKRKP